jgi:hypothetical protein
MRPGFPGVVLPGFRPRVGGLVKQFALYRGAHAQGGVTSPAVVEDFQIVEDGVGQFDACVPAFSVERLGLHSAPERFDDRVVAAISDRPHRGHQSGPLSAVDDDAGSGFAVGDGHPQSVAGSLESLNESGSKLSRARCYSI